MSYTETYELISDDFWAFVRQEGDRGDHFRKHYEKIYEGGVIDAKTKRLMALCGAIAAGCKGCILGQTVKAIENGATKEEILETCSVAWSLGGTMAGSQIAMVMGLLREKGMIS